MELIDKSLVSRELATATANQNVDDWKGKMLSSVSQLLAKDPARYRGFGPYWWALKKSMIEAGHDEFGLDVESDMVDRTNYGSPYFNIMAAVMYESWRLDQGLQSDPVHTVVEGDEHIEDVLYDQDMEVVVNFKLYQPPKGGPGKVGNETASTGTIEEAVTTKKNQRDTHSGSRRIRKKTKKAHTLQDSYSFQGLRIAVENKRGGKPRTGVDPDGNRWSIKMKYDYGYIRSSKATDGECVDCYVNKLGRKSNKVFVVHQHRIEVVRKWKNGVCPKCNKIHSECPHAYDEDKVMLGFGSKEEAVKAYNRHYDSPLFLGPVSTYSLKEFRKALESSFGKRLPLNIEESVIAASTLDELKEIFQ
ncbi:MAG: hypothetical protein GY866_28965 [Proteobacteria bacterium]|nr:hypothetical protein [Pseudomonadota bacterium]